MQFEHSAGGVVYKILKTKNQKQKTKNQKQKILWLLVKHSGYHKWVLPKGLVEEGEDPKKTALREVKEEGGVKAKIIKKIPFEVKYFYYRAGEKVFKKVDFYLMEYQSGDIKNHDWEMEAVEWVDYEEGLRRLAFKGEKKVFQEAQKLLEKECWSA
jgi:8-oxo-dGTP diphosphatase